MQDAWIDLDHNATTPVLPAVVEAMLPFLTTTQGNPSSHHGPGRAAREALERAREQVAALLDAHPDEIVFTSGGTEANNLALHGVWATRPPERDGVRTSAVEHPAVLAPCRHLAGARVSLAAVDRTGRVDPEAFLADVDARTALVSLMLANNEVGTLQPVAEVARVARSRGARVHTDAAQAVGKIPVHPHELGVDLLSIAGHKVHAPKGIGALWVRRGLRLEGPLQGASQERGRRPGTENVAGIVGLGAACAHAAAGMTDRSHALEGLRERLWSRLSEAIPGLFRTSPREGCLPNTLHVLFPGVTGRSVLDEAAIVLASTGAACHDGGSGSAVLDAMGVVPERARGAVRLSLGTDTDEADVARATEALATAWRRLTA